MSESSPQTAVGSNDQLGVLCEPSVHGLHAGSGCTHLHELKVWSAFFDALMVGTKTFEVRRDDRGFKPGDYLRLREWQENQYTGRELTKRVTYMLQGGAFGVEAGHVVLAQDLRSLADAVERGEITDLVACFVEDDHYCYLWGTSLFDALGMSVLLHQQAIDRMRA